MNSYRKRISWKAVFLLSITALEGLAIGAKAPEASSGALVQAGSFSQRCASVLHLPATMPPLSFSMAGMMLHCSWHATACMPVVSCIRDLKAERVI